MRSYKYTSGVALLLLNNHSFHIELIIFQVPQQTRKIGRLMSGDSVDHCDNDINCDDTMKL